MKRVKVFVSVLFALAITLSIVGPASADDTQSCLSQETIWEKCVQDCDYAWNVCRRSGGSLDICNDQEASCDSDCDSGISWWCGFPVY